MAYTVSLSGSAEADAYAAFEHIREVAPASAARWLTGLFAAIQTLADMPARCPVIPEADELGQPAAPFVIRQADRHVSDYLRHPGRLRGRPARPRAENMACCTRRPHR